MTRLVALTLLLRSLYDLTYGPLTWTGQLVARQSKPGDGPSQKVPCPNCDGKKETRRRGVPYACTFCLSDKGLPLGWIYVDGNINEAFQRKIGTLETGLVRQVVTVSCDACGGEGAHPNYHPCETCGGSGVHEVPLTRFLLKKARFSADASELGPGDPVLAAMERREKAGDYEQLGLALAALRLELPRAYRTVVRVYLEASLEAEQLSERSQLAHDVGLRYLLDLMPEEIRVPSWAARNERRRRDNLKQKGVAA